MNNSRLLDKMQNSYSSLTPGEKSVAEYIVNNHQKAAFLTSIEIGEAANVSDTTVIRLANTLGYSKFSDFKKDLQEIIKDRITPKEKLDITLEDIEEKDIVREIYELDRQNLERTFEALDAGAINQVIDGICKSRKIFAMGMGLSASAVHFLSYRLKRIQKDVVEINAGSYSLVAQMSIMLPEDIFIAFDFPRYSREIYETMKFIKEDIGGKTVLITDNPLNPLQEYSDITLTAHNDTLGFTNSCIGTDFLVNILSVGVILRETQHSLLSLEKIEKFSRSLGHCL